MSITISNSLEWLERMGDWLNPILVKETRQALKSRQFIVTFLLMLISSWLISVFGVLMAGEALEFGSAGRSFFIFYYDVLALAIFAVVPFTAYRGLLVEREQTTLELLNITTLSPRQLVWGKLASAMVQVFIYYSAIAPFIAFTSMLQGFDLALVVFSLLISIVITLTLTMLALMLAAVPQSKHVQGGATLVMFGGLLWVVGMILVAAAELLMQTIPFDDREFWMGTGSFVVGALSYFFLFTQVAVAHLTFESDNRSTNIRLACSAQFVLYWLALAAVRWLSPGTPFHTTDYAGFSTVCAIHCAFIGFFTSSEVDYVSRRVRRGYPRGDLLRFLAVPFFPGGNRGFLYALLHLALIPVMATLVFGPGRFWNDWPGFWTLLLVSYVVAYLGLGAAFGRLLRMASSEVKPMHTRVITLIAFAVGLIVPYLPTMFHHQKFQWATDLLRVTNPIDTLNRISNGWNGLMGHEAFVICGAAAFGVLFNLRPMAAGIIEVLREPLLPVRQPLASGDNETLALQPAE